MPCVALVRMREDRWPLGLAWWRLFAAQLE